MMMFESAGFPDLNTGRSLKLKEDESVDEAIVAVFTSDSDDIFNGEVWNHSENREQDEKSMIRANPEEEYFRLVSGYQSY